MWYTVVFERNSRIAKCHIVSACRECLSAHVATSLSDMFKHSSMPFRCLWYGIVVVCFVPCDVSNVVTVLVLYSSELSERNVLIGRPWWVCFSCGVFLIMAGAWERDSRGIVF